MSGKAYQNEEDKQIARQAKNNKRDKRRAKAAEEDDDHFENLFDKYKTTLLKKLGDGEGKSGAKKGKGGKNEASFEEVVMSD